MNLVDPLAEKYAKEHSSLLSEVLIDIEVQTIAQHPHAHMLSGSIQGKFLEMISCMVQPDNVLEIGTFTGYSALCLIKGLSKNGHLHTIEVREEDAAIAAANIKKAGMEDKITLHLGNALEIIPHLNKTWDLVFLDADKVNYINYYELTLPKLKTNGFIIADNVLFHGQVLDEELKGKNAKAIDAFNKHVGVDSRVEQVVLSIRDGISIIRKL